jgi:hypothetical protein
MLRPARLYVEARMSTNDETLVRKITPSKGTVTSQAFPGAIKQRKRPVFSLAV